VESYWAILNKKTLSESSYLKFLHQNSLNAALCNQALDKQGNTPLHLAAIYQKTDVIQKLLKLGADPHKTNALSLSFLDLLYYLNDKNISSQSISVYSNKENTIKQLSEERFERVFSVKYLDHLQFESSQILHWVIQKGRRKLQKTSIKKTNHWITSLLEKELKKGIKPPVYLKWINSYVGYGIFAVEDIPQFTFVGEYTGVIKRRKRKDDLSNDYIFGYVVGPSKTPFIIDAKKKGNFVRFINHSDEPNLSSRWMIVDGLSHIVLFANRFIPKDAQLTYDYGPVYWKKRSAPLFF